MDIHQFRSVIANMQREDVLSMRKQLFASNQHGSGKNRNKLVRHTRKSPKHEWPDVGATLTAEYYGVIYTAEIIAANKRLKSGKQVRITSGPASGNICDSLSDAMLKATEKQREASDLRRKGVSNGCDFWQWT